MPSKINIQAFKGNALKPYLPSIARIRCEVYREYPYLFNVDLDAETKYLETHLDTEESIAVLVFDESSIVGVSTGTPLEDEPEKIQQPFIDQKLDISSFYYFGKSFILKPYRGRGIGHHFFEIRELYAQRLERFRHICFSSIVRPANHPLKPKEYLPLETFWKKRGYAPHPDLSYSVQREDLSDEKNSEKLMIFWTKDLP